MKNILCTVNKSKECENVCSHMYIHKKQQEQGKQIMLNKSQVAENINEQINSRSAVAEVERKICFIVVFY